MKMNIENGLNESLPQHEDNNKLEKDKIICLKHILKELYEPSKYSLFAHGTSVETAKKIIKTGLEARNNDLPETVKTLFDSNKSFEKQPDEYFKQFLHWPHRNYKGIVLIALPNPAQNDVGGLRYFNNVFEELPQEKIVDLGIQGFDKRYVIPTRFIKGYIDIEKLKLVKNETYDSNAKIKITELNKVVVDSLFDNAKEGNDEKISIPSSPQNNSDNIDDVW